MLPYRYAWHVERNSLTLGTTVRMRSSSFSRSDGSYVAGTDDLTNTGPICEDPRQAVPASGQKWTSLAELGEDHHHSLLQDEEDHRITFIQTEPGFAINQTREISNPPGREPG